ncbi:hypothetical protein [Nonomuraea bangladeshensis]|uniref:hypothetical protein n=1 Tax=Nonomuraea bangladeshensis TaxID=404385 RepID=UPI0031CF69F1
MPSNRTFASRAALIIRWAAGPDTPFAVVEAFGHVVEVVGNPEAVLTCNHDPVKALCHPERTARAKRDLPPAIDRCDPACANIARTDTHIEALQSEVAQLQEEIADPLTPTPLRERLKQRVAALRGIKSRASTVRSIKSSRGQ